MTIMLDWLTVPKVAVLVGVSAVILGRKEVLHIALVSGRMTGRALGTLREGRGALQRFLRETNVDVAGLNSEMQESLAEVRAIRAELQAMGNFSPRMLTRGAFEEDHGGRVDIAGNLRAAGIQSEDLEQPYSPTGQGATVAAPAVPPTGSTTATKDASAGLSKAAQALEPGAVRHVMKQGGPIERPKRSEVTPGSAKHLAVMSVAHDDITFTSRAEVPSSGADIVAQSIVDRALLDFAEDKGLAGGDDDKSGR